MKTKFFICPICGNVIVKVIDSDVIPVCCGHEMAVLEPGVTDGEHEKHVPVVECPDEKTVKVKVGSLPHPMMKEHFIRFVYLETKHGGQLKYLKPDDEPEVTFCLCHDRPTAVYEYCNIHALWRTDIHCEKKDITCGK